MSEPKIKALPLNGRANSNADIAAHLRELADWIDAGDYGDLRNVFLIIEPRTGAITRCVYGAPCDLARFVGVMTIAAARAGTGDG